MEKVYQLLSIFFYFFVAKDTSFQHVRHYEYPTRKGNLCGQNSVQGSTLIDKMEHNFLDGCVFHVYEQ